MTAPVVESLCWPEVALAVVREDVTVMVSLLASNVVFPAESFGVIVKVADSLAPADAEALLNVNEAGAPATLQTTVVYGSAGISPFGVVLGVDEFVSFARLSNQTKYVMVAYFFVMMSPSTMMPVRVDNVSRETECTCVASVTEDVALSVLRVAEDWAA